MFGWMRNLLGVRQGDSVRVVDGPYEGKTGTVLRVDGGHYAVYIDECCQPVLARQQLRVAGRRNIGLAMRQAKESDTEGEMARAAAEIRDWVDSVGPH